MSTANLLTLPPTRVHGIKFGNAERLFWQGAALMALLIAVTKGVGWVERQLFHRSETHCFVQEATRTITHYISVSHFGIALLFSLTSVRNRSWSRQFLLFGFLLAGIGLYWAFRAFGQRIVSLDLLTYSPDYFGYPNFTMMVLIYVYFFIHELRDQAFFYTALGDTPPIADKVHFARLVRCLITLAILGVGVFLWPLVVFEVFHKVRHVLAPEVGTALRLCIALAPAVVWVLGGYSWLAWQGREEPKGVADLVRKHGPLFRVYAGEFLVLALGMAITGRPFIIVIFHIIVWYLFTCHKLKDTTPARAPQGWWQWMRTTQPGFQALHNGIALVLITAGGIWVYGFGGQSLVCQQLIVCWTIIHITMGFVPR